MERAPSPPLFLSFRFQQASREASWDPRKTAAIVCDMWDRHWCRSATERVVEMAPRMNRVLHALRDRGALIIHAPSGTMEFYRDHPGRTMAMETPAEAPGGPSAPLAAWVSLDPAAEGELPIDDADGGCPDTPPCAQGRPWSRQIPAIDIEEGDAVTDSPEAVRLMRHRGIGNVILMGVHANMCVLGRPFGIRQLVRQGFRVALLRDMTDTMYNPARRPRVDHFTGTDLVIRHIEKHWCPTFTSNQLLPGSPGDRAPFRFAGDVRKEDGEEPC